TSVKELAPNNFGEGTADKDTECLHCTDGTFSNGTSTSCQNHTKCESVGLKLMRPGTDSTDSECGEHGPHRGLVAGIVIPGVVMALIIGGLILHKKKREWRLTSKMETLSQELSQGCCLTGIYSPAPTGDQQEHPTTTPAAAMDDHDGDQSLGPPQVPHNGSVSLPQHPEETQTVLFRTDGGQDLCPSQSESPLLLPVHPPHSGSPLPLPVHPPQSGSPLPLPVHPPQSGSPLPLPVHPPQPGSPLPLPVPPPHSGAPLPLPVHPPQSGAPLPLPVHPPQSGSPLPLPVHPPQPGSPLPLPVPPPHSGAPLPLPVPPPHSGAPLPLPVHPPQSGSPLPLPVHPPHSGSPLPLPVPVHPPHSGAPLPLPVPVHPPHSGAPLPLPVHPSQSG
ncbi:uncharacterized protein LOC132464133, partial [Gadus macrocephalus]|uniref:uncharacterized protein LOC132464133 n=1 Tax=Gadus macrocephalus TaxID=80720 RepID=UPI0028CB9228